MLYVHAPLPVSLRIKYQLILADKSSWETKLYQLNVTDLHAIVDHPYRYRYRPSIDITGSAIVYT